MTEVEEKLWLENIQLRKQAHYYQSLHAQALVKQQEQADQIDALKAKVAELQKRLFGRKRERGGSSEAWLAKRSPRRSRGQQRGTRGHGRRRRTTFRAPELNGSGFSESAMNWRVWPRVVVEAAGSGIDTGLPALDPGWSGSPPATERPLARHDQGV